MTKKRSCKGKQVASLRKAKMTDKTCEVCKGTGWVCENHRDTPWGSDAGECNCGAGCNCYCNPGGEVRWQVVYATTEPKEVKEWVH